MNQNSILNQPDNLEYLIAIAQKFVSNFAPKAEIKNIQPFGNGNINSTFLVFVKGIEQEIKQEIEIKSLTTSFVLQRINTNVFPEPQLVMQNMRIYSNHVRDRLAKIPLQRRWEVPQVLLIDEGQDYWLTENGEYWRSLSFIADSLSFDVMENTSQASEVGYALGTFHYLTSDLSPEKLADTLVGFHITPQYLRQYQEVLAKSQAENKVQNSPELNYCFQIISDRQGLANILEDAKVSGKLALRTMHGDPKVNNILFDQQTNLAMSMIDLDTVKSGLIHYDIGDCLRSGCNPLGEDVAEWEEVNFDTELCSAILSGYLEIGRSFLTEYDYAYIYDAIRVITFELGLRFFADYLAGNQYFTVKYPEHNLLRSLVQFRLLESIEAQESIIQTIIQSAWH
jgi:Ser/Thr protein kinase RdoA (MazF antagonist)